MPLQALTATFVPALFFAGFLLVRSIVALWEPEPAVVRNVTLLSVALLVGIGSIVQYR